MMPSWHSPPGHNSGCCRLEVFTFGTRGRWHLARLVVNPQHGQASVLDHIQWPSFFCKASKPTRPRPETCRVRRQSGAGTTRGSPEARDVLACQLGRGVPAVAVQAEIAAAPGFR
jgi:hypothetical protein